MVERAPDPRSGSGTPSIRVPSLGAVDLSRQSEAYRSSLVNKGISELKRSNQPRFDQPIRHFTGATDDLGTLGKNVAGIIDKTKGDAFEKASEGQKLNIVEQFATAIPSIKAAHDRGVDKAYMINAISEFQERMNVDELEYQDDPDKFQERMRAYAIKSAEQIKDPNNRSLFLGQVNKPIEANTQALRKRKKLVEDQTAALGANINAKKLLNDVVADVEQNRVPNLDELYGAINAITDISPVAGAEFQAKVDQDLQIAGIRGEFAISDDKENFIRELATGDVYYYDEINDENIKINLDRKLRINLVTEFQGHLAKQSQQAGAYVKKMSFELHKGIAMLEKNQEPENMDQLMDYALQLAAYAETNSNTTVRNLVDKFYRTPEEARKKARDKEADDIAFRLEKGLEGDEPFDPQDIVKLSQYAEDEQSLSDYKLVNRVKDDIQEFHNAIAIKGYVDGFKDLPYGRRAEAIAEVRTHVGQSDNQDENDYIAQLHDTIVSVHKDLTDPKDPRQAAIDYGLVEDVPVDRIETRLQQGSYLKDYFNLDVVPVLTDAEASSLGMEMESIVEIQQMSQGNPEVAAAIYDQVASDEPMLPIMGSIFAHGNAASNRVVMHTMEGYEFLKMSKSSLEDLPDTYDKIRNNLFDVLPAAARLDPGLQKGMTESIISLAASIEIQTNDTPSKISRDSIDKATALILAGVDDLDQVATVNGQKVIPPKFGVRGNEVERVIDDIDDNALDILSNGGAYTSDGEMYSAEEIRSDGIWLAVAPGQYQVLMPSPDSLDPVAPLRDSTGMPIKFNWDDITSIQEAQKAITGTGRTRGFIGRGRR